MLRKLLAGTCLMLSSVASAQNMTWDNLMFSHAKLQQSSFNFQKHVDSYMKLYREAVWNQYKHDEFELEEKRQETIQLMQSAFTAVNLEKSFTIPTNIKFGAYNFKTEEFPLKRLSERSFYYATRWDHGTFPSKYKVFFKNYGIIKNLKMEKDEAKAFLKTKKDPYGGIDRALPTEIKFKVTSLGQDPGELKAEITEVIIYNDKNQRTVLAKFTK